VAKPLTPETIVYGFTLAGDPNVSPDGKQIVYTVTTIDAAKSKNKPDTQLWLSDIDGGNRRQLTYAGKSNGEPRWSPDGSRIAFTSDRVEDKKSGIFVLDINQGGDARELTSHAQGISNLTWAPNGKRLAYITDFDPDNPDEEKHPEDEPPKVRATSRIDYKQDGRGYVGDKRQQVFVVDVESGERRKLTNKPVDYAVPRWSPDSKWIAASVSNRNGMHSQLAIIAADSGEEKLVGPEDGTISQHAWSADGKRIAIAGDDQKSWQSDIFVYDVGKDDLRRVTDDLHVLPDIPDGMLWAGDNEILINARREGGSGLYTVNLETGEVKTVHDHEATNTNFSVDESGRYIVRGHTSFDNHGEVSVFDRQSGSAKLVTSYSDAVFETSPPSLWERFEIQRGKYTIEAWLLKPADFDPNKKYPVVLDIHGGPNGHYGYQFNPMQQNLSSNGFLVVASNPRGSSSYGREFTMQVAEDWGGEDYLDLMAVVDKVLERPYADSERIGCWGYSYGGYMTSWIIGQTDRFKACVCGAPCFDLESMYGTSDISHTFGELQWGGPPHESVEWYRDHSPSTYAHKVVTPTLIIHGETDERCPIGQGEQMFIALKKAGVETEFARYPNGHHGMMRLGPPAHRVDILQRTLSWFKRHLGEPA
jgi:dipeptidyl aminopeptidase/acylaminoacyl peptidase